MSWLYVAGVAYGLTGFFLVGMTYLEGLQAHAPWNMYRVAGLLVCVFWADSVSVSDAQDGIEKTNSGALTARASGAYPQRGA